MKVRLKNDWFGPDATLYRVKDNPHYFPEDWRTQLPKSAKVEDGGDRDYAKLQERQTEEPSLLAIQNNQRYKGEQPEDANLAQVVSTTTKNDGPVKEDEEETQEDSRRKELEGMTVPQLQQRAKTLGVKTESDDNKDSIITKILAKK